MGTLLQLIIFNIAEKLAYKNQCILMVLLENTR